MRIALRRLAKSPSYVGILMLLLGLGAGIGGSAFSVVRRYILEDPPFHDPARVVKLEVSSREGSGFEFSPAQYFDIKENAVSFESISAFYVDWFASIADGGSILEKATAMAVTAEFFDTLGIVPARGSGFASAGNSAGREVAVISNALWRSHYSGHEDAIGAKLQINGRLATIIGIMPAFLDNSMAFGSRIDVWYLHDINAVKNVRAKSWYGVAARLAKNVGLNSANAELSALSYRFERQFPETQAGKKFALNRYPPTEIGPDQYRLLWIVLALSLLVLVIVAANVGSLNLIRVTGRLSDFAIATSLGASRWNLMAPILTEALVVALVSAPAAMSVAYLNNMILSAHLAVGVPTDWTALLFCLFCTLLSMLGAGMLPVMWIWRHSPSTLLKSQSKGATSSSRYKVRNALLITQITIALSLISAAGYFVIGIFSLRKLEKDWAANGIVVGRFALPSSTYGEERDERSHQFGRRLLDELNAIPGIGSVCISRYSPIFGMPAPKKVSVEGSDLVDLSSLPTAQFEDVSTNFFKTYGITQIAGRAFDDFDSAGARRVVILSSTLAQKLYPHRSPLGQTLNVQRTGTVDVVEIVGVVSDTWVIGKPAGNVPILYFPWRQNAFRYISISARASMPPAMVKTKLIECVRKLEPAATMSYLESSTEALDEEISNYAIQSRSMIEVAALGLLLSGAGIFGSLAAMEVERRREVAIRLALGADHAAIVRLFIRDMFSVIIKGLLIGAPISYLVVKVLSSHVPGIPANIAVVMGSAACLLLLTIALSVYLPLTKISKIEPSRALVSY